MSHKFVVAPATLDHVMAIVPYIRAEDRAEWMAGTGDSTRRRLAGAVLDPSGVARSIFVSGIEHPILIWGVNASKDDPKVGQPWLIAADEAVPYAIALHSLLPRELPILDGDYERLVAYADQRNTVHHRWLRWLGFIERGTVRLGPWSLPFLQFERTPECASPSSAPS